MRKVVHAELYSENFSILDQMIKDWNSAYRFSYKRFKEGKSFNEARKATKAIYKSLNTRQISDAVNAARQLYRRCKDKKVIFGGRKNWNKLVQGDISNSEWKQLRDNQIYCRGDATKSGNPNLRVSKELDKLRITYGNRLFISYQLFVPKKFRKRLKKLLKSGIAYNVRLIKKDTIHYKVCIDYESSIPKVLPNQGVVGIDINPDRLALAYVSNDGNLEHTYTLVNNRLTCANTNKRDYDISILIKTIVNLALQDNRKVVFENLQFPKKFKNQGRKFNRIKSNFPWKKFLMQLERKCVEHGIEYKKVNPAFTSVIGKLKYQKMYNLNTHESAAFVIGRRGMGYNEKLSLYKQDPKRVKEILLNLAGRDSRSHSWKLWRLLRDNYHSVLTALKFSLSDLKELDDHGLDKGENPLGETSNAQLVS